MRAVRNQKSEPATRTIGFSRKSGPPIRATYGSFERNTNVTSASLSSPGNGSTIGDFPFWPVHHASTAAAFFDRRARHSSITRELAMRSFARCSAYSSAVRSSSSRPS